MIVRPTVARSAPTGAPGDWDELTGASGADFYSSRRWHLAMAGLNGADERLVVSRGTAGGLRAVVPVFGFAAGTANPLMHPGTLFGGAQSPSDATAERWEPLTVVGNVSGYSTVPVAADARAWAEAADQAWDRRAGGTAWAPYLTGADVDGLSAALPGRPVLLTALRVVVPVPGSTLEEYYAAIPRRRRELARRERRQLAGAGREITVEELDEVNIPEFARLQVNTQRRHGSFGDAAFFEVLFGQMAKALAGQVFAFVCRDGGRALGFMWAVRHGRALVARSIGLDYERVGAHAEYFNLMIHEPVRYCLEHGLTEIDMSVGSYRQKLLRGGIPTPAWSILLRPPPFWTERDTERHNRDRARELLAELHPLAPAAVVEELEQIARAGRRES
ncbi:GNAT family N-acetyltransferase [Pseudonocardia sp. TRM90224]|uniref:GNAT family N-acetyltransferase n=1 Tax=Pseudonocardia sp. TRM90224 TaxID=2812678 RepID=UPI001E428A87|nr:GNAT family N-acetyltransferase [Pseudonocardia sp. TRM90224]